MSKKTKRAFPKFEAAGKELTLNGRGDVVEVHENYNGEGKDWEQVHVRAKELDALVAISEAAIAVEAAQEALDKAEGKVGNTADEEYELASSGCGDVNVGCQEITREQLIRVHKLSQRARQRGPRSRK